MELWDRSVVLADGESQGASLAILRSTLGRLLHGPSSRPFWRLDEGAAC